MHNMIYNFVFFQGCDQYMFGNGGAGVIQAFNYDNDSVKAKLQGGWILQNSQFLAAAETLNFVH